MLRDKTPYAEQPRLIKMMLDIRRVVVQIARLEGSAKRLDAQKYRCTSNLSGMPHGGQKPDLCDINGEIDEINAQITALKQQRNEMVCQLDTDPDADRLLRDEYDALKLKYIYDMTQEQIAGELHISVAKVGRDIRSGYEKLICF